MAFGRAFTKFTTMVAFESASVTVVNEFGTGDGSGTAWSLEGKLFTQFRDGIERSK